MAVKRKPPPHAFKKGDPKNPARKANRRRTGSGRKTGTPNVVTRNMREAIINAFERMGGEDYLIKNRRDFRTMGGLLRAVIPQEIKQTGHDPEEVATKIREQMSPDMDAATQSKPKEEKKK